MLGVGSNEWLACQKWNILPKSDIPACQGKRYKPEEIVAKLRQVGRLRTNDPYFRYYFPLLIDVRIRLLLRTPHHMTATLIGYARCSMDKQDLTSQRQALAELGVASDRIYMDKGLTGTNRVRPGLDQAMAAVRKGDTLVVPKLDRLARSVPDARHMRSQPHLFSTRIKGHSKGLS